MFGKCLKDAGIGSFFVPVFIFFWSVLPGLSIEVRLFGPGGAAGLVLAPPPDFPAAARQRPVVLAPHIGVPGMLSQGDTLVLDLFPDRVYRARIDLAEVNVNGTWTIRGRIEGYPLGYLLVSTTGERSLGSIRIPEREEHYVILSEPVAFTHYLIEPLMHLRDEVQVGPPLIPPPSPGVEIADIEKRRSTVSSAGPRDPAQIDVMIVYTPAAAQWADQSGGGIANIIAQTMAKTRLALDNSNVILTMPLVRSFQVQYTESGNSTLDLTRLTYHAAYDPWINDPDRHMDEVHAWRDQYGADLVSLFALVGDTGGLAWLLSSPAGRPQFGFSLVRIQQAATTFTHIHEMGHNMGCHHHKAQNVQPGPGLFGFSAGWRWIGSDGGRYCSIMTYESGTYFADGLAHVRTPFFSDPGIFYQGIPTGHSADGDNARTIRETKHAVAAYRAVPTNTLTITAGPGGTTDPAPGTHAYIPGDSVSVTALPQDRHIFTSWSGDAAGPANPVAIIMDRNKTIAADFRAVEAPLNASGRKVLNRSLLQSEYINILSWRANPANQGITLVKYRIHQRRGGIWSLLAELDPGVFEYRHRKVEKSEAYTYAVVAVVEGGREGFPADVIVQ